MKNINNLIENKLIVYIDFSFLREALDLIVESRRAITMTYPVGYYIKWTQTNLELFQHQQGLLWQTLDTLDEFTDKYISEGECLDLLSNFSDRGIILFI